MSRRVAVTGIGAITAAGSTADGLWKGVLAGRSPVRRITRFDASSFRSRIAAEVDDSQLGTNVAEGRHRRLDRFGQFAVTASEQALRDAGLEGMNGQSPDVAVYIGSALGGIAYAEDQHSRFLESGIRAVAPALALSVFAGAAATNVAMEYGFCGPAISNANSCASGAIAIGEAFRLVRYGGADVALAGGVECPLAPLTFGSFALIRAMSRRNDDPEAACRPFSTARDGFVMGEGAAVLVLEDWDRARRRGARIRGEILGYASTNDAHHMTAPLPDGREAARAMLLALNDAGSSQGQIDYVNAHATGTPLGDSAEAAAMHSVFDSNMPPCSATKPLHGHALGASAAIEAAITIMALEHGFVPGTLNLADADPTCDVNHVPAPGRPFSGRLAMSNAFGFGGINASLILARSDLGK